MKETGLLMKPELVKASLEDRKLMTRRVVKGEISEVDGMPTLNGQPLIGCPAVLAQCPYGGPGDRLWIREEHYMFGQWFPINSDHTRWSFKVEKREGVKFDRPEVVKTVRGGPVGWWKRNSLFMPRGACRLVLEITEVRVERLNDISEADAIAEGIKPLPHHPGRWWFEGSSLNFPSTRNAYGALWDSINGPGEWAKNPWVWVIKYKRITT
jgi:hypothetical protein